MDVVSFFSMDILDISVLTWLIIIGVILVVALFAMRFFKKTEKTIVASSPAAQLPITQANNFTGQQQTSPSQDLATAAASSPIAQAPLPSSPAPNGPSQPAPLPPRIDALPVPEPGTSLKQLLVTKFQPKIEGQLGSKITVIDFAPAGEGFSVLAEISGVQISLSLDSSGKIVDYKKIKQDGSQAPAAASP